MISEANLIDWYDQFLWQSSHIYLARKAIQSCSVCPLALCFPAKLRERVCIDVDAP